MRWRNTRRGRIAIGRGGKSRGKRKEKKYAAESVEKSWKEGEGNARERKREKERKRDWHACKRMHVIAHARVSGEQSSSPMNSSTWTRNSTHRYRKRRDTPRKTKEKLACTREHGRVTIERTDDDVYAPSWIFEEISCRFLTLPFPCRWTLSQFFTWVSANTCSRASFPIDASQPLLRIDFSRLRAAGWFNETASSLFYR